ncbi:MAG: DUF1080 domain-containing protein [Bryobacteraceae bacterium]
MRLLVLFVVCLGLAYSQVTPQEAAEGWIALFDGETLFGWTPEGGSKWRVVNGAIVPEEGESGWLRHNAVFADYALRVEYRVASADVNSGILLRAPRTGPPALMGYEVQIFDTHPSYPTGALVNHLKPRRVAPAPNRWRTVEIEHSGEQIIVKVDGRTVLDGLDSHAAAGHIGLQYNRGHHIEFRSVRLRPLGLEPVFNGRDLAGWKEVGTPRAKEPPVWSVRDGMINVVKGPGQLETESLYRDFVLQLDVRANARDANHHPNSGVFFRGEPGGFWTGYESQIRNEFKDGDPAQPVDFGTGGVYFYQPARKVVSRDNEFFTKTIVAYGRSINIWVNGYPVSSWEDPHPEGAVVRNKEARLGAGAISLQAHDPTTNLDFRKIVVAELP